MKSAATLKDVQAVYSGAEGQLWELVMGQQIHIGGFRSSMDLADKAGIGAGMSGVDLCCCNGAGMRFLTRFRNVAKMQGVDATETVVELGRRRCEAEGLADRIQFTLGDACDTKLPGASADFVWGEDAWCYVVDKKRLIAEAARLVKPGGVIAFTDWVDGSTPWSDGEADRYRTFMKFPNTLTLDGYASLLAANGCEVLKAEDTGRYAAHVDLYLDMLNMQLTYDALKVIGFDMPLMEMLGGEMNFLRDMAHAGKIVQGLFVARKKA
jgi:SAM-dependent methyltransferase